MAFNTDVAKGQWSEIKGKIKSKWAKFTDQDLTSVEGNLEELKGKLQQVYGYSKERAHTEFQNTFSDLKAFGDKISGEATDKVNGKIDSAKAKADVAQEKVTKTKLDS